MQIETSYEQAVARKYPEQVAIAIAKDAQGKHNPISLGWLMLTSHQPPMMAISIGQARHSLATIRKAKEFVVCFPSSTMAAEALLFGTRSGRDLDKLVASGAETQPATQIDSVLLSDGVANFECKLVSEMETGDHVIFVGQVLAAHMNEDQSARRLFTLEKDRLGGVVPG